MDVLPSVADPFADSKIVRALAVATARFGTRPDVAGVDVGFKMKAGRHLGTLAIRIHVREKVERRHLSARERFPRTLEGVPVDVIEADYRNHVFDAARQTRLNVVQPGVSVGTPDGATGTLGLLVRDVVDNRRLLLGSAHVLAALGGARPGDPIIQPGMADSGVAQDTVGWLHRIDAQTDSAVAVALDVRTWDTRILDPGGPVAITALRHPQLGDVLTKSGRTTGVTRGVVDGIAPSFGGLRFVFRLVPQPGDAGTLCDFGDSGAVWYDAANQQAVGLHSKGGDTPTRTNAYAIATSLIYATGRLGVVL